MIHVWNGSEHGFGREGGSALSGGWGSTLGYIFLGLGSDGRVDGPCVGIGVRYWDIYLFVVVLSLFELRMRYIETIPPHYTEMGNSSLNP